MPTHPPVPLDQLELRLEALEQTVAARTVATSTDGLLTVVAAQLGITEDNLLDLVVKYGWPDLDRLNAALGRLRSVIVQRRAAQHAGRELADEADQDAPAETVVPAPSDTGYEALLIEAERNPRAAIRSKAKRVRELLDELDDFLAEETKRAAEEERLRLERAEAEQEVAELEAQLAEARARAGVKRSRTAATPKPTVSAAGATAKEVRAWARANGVEVSPTGRVNASAVDAYRSAHAGVGA